MTLLKVVHNKNYTVINNFICTDDRISWKAKGLWLYAFSRKDDWSFYITDLVQRSTDGKDSVYSGLRELEKFGYLIRKQHQNEDGTWGNMEWTFIEKPKLNKNIPKTENPEAGFPDTENPPLVNTDCLASTEKQQQQGASAPVPDAVVSIHECLKKINIPEKDKIWISKTYDIPTVQHAIAFATHPLTMIKKGLVETIKWACIDKPHIPKNPEDHISTNKELAKRLENTLKLPATVRFEALNKYVEIGYKYGQKEPTTIEYGLASFKDLIQKALQNHGCQQPQPAR